MRQSDPLTRKSHLILGYRPNALQSSPNRNPRGLVFLVFAMLSNVLPASIWAVPQTELSSEASKQVRGSRLLQPGSFGFTIPVAEVQPNDQEAVETINEDGEKVTALSYVKVGENYVVLLPSGQLVDRFAKDITASDKKFEAMSQKELARKILDEKLARFSNVKADRSKHYIYLYNTTEAFKKATRDILESMFNGVKAYAKNMGVETYNPRVPLVVIMFRTQAEFQAFREMPRGVVAYYDMVSNHIVLCEESPLINIRPDLAQGQLLSTIAHEGAHQILHNIGVQNRLSMWPMWLSEGIAEFFAPTSFGKRNRWKGAGDVNNLRMFELESFLQTRFIEGVDGKTVRETVTAPRLDSTGYAAAWSIVHFLAKKKRRQFNDYVAQMSQLQPMRGMVARPNDPVVENLEHFQSFFGEDLEKNEQDMIKYLTGLNYESPVGDFVHYVGLVQVPAADGNGTKRFACCFHTPEKVDAWKAVLLEKLSSQQIQQAEWNLQKATNRDKANILLRRFLK